ncbi:MAG: ribosome biogenesis GTPase Der [Alphaproteobacteria bacterium]|nr:ribosome biogenesis GTPase Der [Alphaproteobacteria bacterium]
MSLQRVAIIGRPNVGKSTLFNRLCGKKLAIVEDIPGVTRDWKQAPAKLFDLRFELVDTAGLEGFESAEIKTQILDQTARVIQDSEVLLFLVDGRDGILSSDHTLAELVRRSEKPVVVLVNKCEKETNAFLEAAALGLGAHEPIGISALQGIGLEDLYPLLRDYLGKTRPPHKEKEGDEDTPPLQMALIGRPNAGKSTLINRLFGENRVICGEQPGITRDAIRLDWAYDGRPIKLVDTAGVRKRAKVSDALEQLSVRDTLQAVRFAHVAVLVVDARMALDRQDVLLAQKVIEEGRCLVIAVNKWDLADKVSFDQIKDVLLTSLSEVKGVPVIPISAKTGQNMDKLMAAVFKMYDLWNCRISTGELNRWLEHATTRHPLPLSGAGRIRIKYATQIKTRPPTIALFVSKPQDLPASYLRYLMTSLREDFDLPGIPLRLWVRKGANPYADKDGKKSAPKKGKPS